MLSESITLFYLIPNYLRKHFVEHFDAVHRGNHNVSDTVNQQKETYCDVSIILDIYLSCVYCAIANNADNIKGFLYIAREPFLYQIANGSINRHYRV